MDSLLSKREARFVKFYVETNNGAESARRAVYGHAGAHVQAHRLLRRDTVVDAIQKLRGKIGRHLEMNAKRTLQEAGRIADFDPIEIFDDDGQVKRVSDIPAGARRCIASISTKRTERPDGTVVVNSNVRFHDKLKALGMHGAVSVGVIGFQETQRRPRAFGSSTLTGLVRAVRQRLYAQNRAV